MRIPPLEPPYSAELTAAFATVMPPGVPPLLLFRTLAQNRRVLERVLAGGLLDRGALTLRERELVIDRTCYRCGAEYEYGVHVAFFGPRAALTPEELHAICTDGAGLPPRDQLLIRLCDELHDTATVGDALWAELAAAWPPAALVELVVLAGLYHAISFAANALRLPLEPFGARFAT